MKKTFSLFYIYFLLASILMCIGLVFVYSASSYLAFNMHKVDSYYIFKQVAGVFLAICMFCLTLFLEVQTIKRYALFFFIISLVLCIATKLPVIGITVNGASRWISLLGIVFQPVEVLKPCSVLFFSYILSRNQYSLNRLIPLFVCVLGLIGIVLLMQPDFGHAAVILSVSIALLYLTGCRIPLLKRF